THPARVAVDGQSGGDLAGGQAGSEGRALPLRVSGELLRLTVFDRHAAVEIVGNDVDAGCDDVDPRGVRRKRRRPVVVAVGADRDDIVESSGPERARTRRLAVAGSRRQNPWTR